MPKVTQHRDKSNWRKMFLGPLEYEVIESIWNLQACSVHDVLRAMPERRAYTTVMTTADRLFHKGILNRKKIDRKFLYSARMNRQQLDIYFGRQLLRQIRLLPVSTRRMVVMTLLKGLGEGVAQSSRLDHTRTAHERKHNASLVTPHEMSGLT